MKIPDFKLGATGRFPRGKADEHDQGELRTALILDREHGVIRLEFGKAITWFGLPPAQARVFARMLLEHADDLERTTEARPSFTCPTCLRISYNPNDVANRYCSFCHVFHGDESPTSQKTSQT